MYSESIKKITGIEKSKGKKYYSRDEENEFERIYIQKLNKRNRENEENEEYEENKENKEFNDMEYLKSNNINIYNKLQQRISNNAEQRNRNSKIQMQKMMEAYNKISKEKQKNNIEKESKEDTQLGEKQTKKQEVEKFRKALKAKEEYDIAFQKFQNELVKRRLEEVRKRKSKYKGYDR